jgi:hypothetical protein
MNIGTWYNIRPTQFGLQAILTTAYGLKNNKVMVDKETGWHSRAGGTLER